MTTKFSLFGVGSAPATSDQVVGLQAGANVRWPMSALATLFGVAKYTTNIGDGSSVSYVVTHSLGTRDVQVQVYRNGTPYDEIIVDVAHTTTNTITLTFTTAPTSNQFRVVVWA
jgi:hypothetical protein